MAFHACGSFFQRDFYAIADVIALVIGLARTACAAKHLAEDVTKIKTLCAAKSAEATKSAKIARACAAKTALFKGGVSVLVVGGFFLRVG